MSIPKLFNAQQGFIDWFTTHPTKRVYLAAGVGTGKTPMALSAARAAGAQRILIVTLAMIRRNWARECQKWLGAPGALIETGRSTKLTKAASAARDAAYNAPVQIVSYDLLKHITPTGWDAIVIDEAHEVASSISKQHKAVAALVAANPTAVVLFLSATPMPTRVSQLWAQYHILAPKCVERPRPRTGEAPWSFLSRYSHLERNEYGTAEGKPNLDRMPELYNRLAPHTYRLTREDIAPEQPALLVSTLELPRLNDPALDTQEWVRTANAKKLIILPYYVDTAERIAQALAPTHNVFLVHGGIPTARRDELLQQAAAAPDCVLVATQDSVGVGVRFMWCEQAVILESRRNPGQVVQLLGRFQSVGSETRPNVQILCDADSLDAAKILVTRAEAVNALFKAGAAESVIGSLFQAAAVSDDDILKMVLSFRESALEVTDGT